MLLDRYYRNKSKKLRQPVSNASVLIVDFSDDMGLPASFLLNDFRSKWLDSNPLVLYKLRSLIVETITEDGSIKTLPLLVRNTDSVEYYSPYHNLSLINKAEIEGVKSLVFERVFEP